MKKWIKVLIILVTGTALAVITFVVNKTYIEKHTDLISVAVAQETVTPYKQLTKYKLEKMVKASIPDDAITNLEELNKQEWYAGKLGIGKGDIVRKSRIQNTINNPFGPAIALKNDKVLVGVKTDQVLSAGRNLKPGVIAHGFVFIPSTERGTPDRVIGPKDDVKLGNLLVREVQNADATKLGDKGREALPVVTVLETTIPVAKQLIYYQEIGTLYLAPSGIDLSSTMALKLNAGLNFTPTTKSETKPNVKTETNFRSQ